MKPTKRQSDPLGRSTTRHRYSRYLLSLAIAITGSVWPIQARSMEPILDTTTATDIRTTRPRPRARPPDSDSAALSPRTPRSSINPSLATLREPFARTV